MKPEKLDGKDIFCSGATKTCTADHDIAQIKSVDMVCSSRQGTCKVQWTGVAASNLARRVRICSRRLLKLVSI